MWLPHDSYTNHPQIKVIHQKNGGVVNARKRGLSESSGKYITFSDSDDYVNSEKYKTMIAIADIIAKEYVPLVRKAVENLYNIYIPSRNYELLEAAAIFYAITNKCVIPMSKDMSKYDIKTTAGGDFVAFVDLRAEQEDKDYVPTIEMKNYWSCGSMLRDSGKYPSVLSSSID